MEPNFNWTPHTGGGQETFSMDLSIDPMEGITEDLIDNGLDNWNRISTDTFSQMMNQPQYPLLPGIGGWSTNQPEAYTSHQIAEPQSEDSSFILRPNPPTPGESSRFNVPEGYQGYCEQYGSPIPALMVNDRPVKDSRELNVSCEANLRSSNWTYAVEVWPARDEPGESYVEAHDKAIRTILDAHALDYRVVITRPVEEPGICRQYSLAQKDRFNDRIRLEFLQAFNATRKYNKQLPHYFFKMSVVYKSRDILPSDPYPPGIDGSDHDGDTRSVRYSPVPPVHYMAYDGAENATLIPPSPNSTDLNSPNMLEPLSPPESLAAPTKSDTNRPSRLGSIPKPDRIETKNRDGLYYCAFPGCTEAVKTFPRKCEWGKHMDKHDRPYKCIASECEKLAGFTYSGGLLRHEREVHGKHGGPRNPLNCPHGNCKRHEGKGFSRMENLNEHLRRVHTPNDAAAANVRGSSSAPSPEGEQDDVSASVAAVVGGVGGAGAGVVVVAASPERTGEKRKPETDLRDEVKRLQVENVSLRDELNAQHRQSMAMMQQIHEMNARLLALSNNAAAAAAAHHNNNPSPSSAEA